MHWIAVEGGHAGAPRLRSPRRLGPGPVQLGADELSFTDAAAMIGEVLGEEVRYEQIALGEVKDGHARGMFRWFQSYAHYHPDAAKLRRIHPGLHDLPAVARGRPSRPAQGRRGTSAAA